MPIRRARCRDLAGASLALFVLSACVPHAAPPAPLPAPAPRPVPLPPPPPPPPPVPPPTDWATGPLSPGDWRYRFSSLDPDATFQSDGARFTIRCRSDRVILLGLNGVQRDTLVIRTSYGERRLPAAVHHDEMIATLSAGDPLLEQMAFSRGRFLVTAEGGASLVVPASPEFARVIEDCRGQ
jgi:hypothetical protein